MDNQFTPEEINFLAGKYESRLPEIRAKAESIGIAQIMATQAENYIQQGIDEAKRREAEALTLNDDEIRYLNRQK